MNKKISYFKGDQYARFDIEKNAVDKGYPTSVKSGWRGLEEAILASSAILKNKNECAPLPNIINLSVKFRWFKSVEFDLAAIYTLKDNRQGIVYFGNKGNINEAPFINLNKDAKYGDSNEEIITIRDLSQFSQLYLACWNYSYKGGTGVFGDADVNVSIVDSNSNSTSVFLQHESGKDAACIA